MLEAKADTTLKEMKFEIGTNQESLEAKIGVNNKKSETL
jgi:hypothetical protein